MKQTFSILMAMVAIMLLNTACDKNSLIEQNPSTEVEMQTITISAGINNDNETKTHIGDPVTEEGVTFRKVYWSAGDEIAAIAVDSNGNEIKDEEGNIKVFNLTLSSGEGSEEGTFTGQIPVGAKIVEALYPFSALGNNLKTEQTATPNSFDPTIATMFGTLNTGGTETNIQFQHLYTYIKVTTDTEYDKITILDAYTLNPATSGEKIQAGTYYIVISPSSSSELTITFKRGDNTYTKASNKEHSFASGIIYNLGEISFDVMRANGHAYVDLGLTSGTLWATCNVGAITPEGCGDYYAWGELETKSRYYSSLYRFGSSSLTKYCTDSKKGKVDNIVTLELGDDIAHCDMGGDWRIPTKDELTELLTECAWLWTTYNNVKGYIVTSNANGNSIFLPAAGLNDGDEPRNIGVNGQYWSSSLYTDNNSSAHALYLLSESYSMTKLTRRYCGLSVRAVMSSAD